MKVQLRAKSQLTLPNAIVKELQLEAEDFLDIVVNEKGHIELIPLKLVPRDMIVKNDK